MPEYVEPEKPLALSKAVVNASGERVAADARGVKGVAGFKPCIHEDARGVALRDLVRSRTVFDGPSLLDRAAEPLDLEA